MKLKLFILAGLLGIAFVGYVFGVHTMIVNALGSSTIGSTFGNPSCVTNAATSSPAYQTAGTASSTVTCTLGADGATSATLSMIVNATSTSSSWLVYVEESQNDTDWFPIELPQLASTTSPFDLTQRNFFSFTFASSTIGQGGIGTGDNYLGVNGENNRNNYIVDVPVRMRMVRAISTIPVGSSAGAMWMQILPKTNY